MNKEYKAFAKLIIEMKENDLNLRQELIDKYELFDGYNKTMEALHIKNAKRLESIIDTIGFPDNRKVGEEAFEAAWLIIQHAISLPSFMKKCAILLHEVVRTNEEKIRLAYLEDRIAVFQDKLQSYGTQFDWDENNVLSPKAFDDLTLVNQRRKKLGMESLEEAILRMRKEAELEGNSPPKNQNELRVNYNQWRKKVGWIS